MGSRTGGLYQPNVTIQRKSAAFEPGPGALAPGTWAYSFAILISATMADALRRCAKRRVKVSGTLCEACRGAQNDQDAECMRPQFLGDADFNHKIVTGLRRREPSLDFLSAIDGCVVGIPDPGVLSIAAELGRILVSHDRKTNGGALSRGFGNGDPLRA